ncbi:5'-methylthioadenosine nucleosidase [Bacillus sp. FJAT-27916]|uniref:5'-methylthioadenosine/S-adenosylhomocysteine nucleosidase n=1 Tax=Bacillus sp. FJAT-27916 TaxID=1679169 RepID=UPI0006711AEE|nr:5'-methylthioadenosine/S-adenosylhomocysteine nucleosidase [Bacillus sp. FJAT-27916]KMY43683.1 5'-methylthioadenosine nucleosidase [Bacillus sp. FJAT-27916]
MKIAIIGAMEEEVAVLRENIEESESVVIANTEYTSGKMFGTDVVLLKSGIGKVNAAMGTAVLLEKFKPDFIINTGSAGGYNPELNVGDIVISTEVRHHDVDVTAFGYEYGQVPRLPVGFVADEKLVELASGIAAGIEGVQAGKGLIVTGDVFMSDPVRADFVRGQFPELQAVEMEAAAIAQVAYQFGVPFVVTRALSDIAGKESDVSFEQFLDKAARHSAHIAMQMVKALGK